MDTDFSRRAIAGVIARGLSLHKRSRLHSLFDAREKRLLGLPKMQRIFLRLADALVVMDSRYIIPAENNSKDLGVDLNAMIAAPSRVIIISWPIS